MDKLQMCRICLAQNVHMYVVVNKELHEVYGKLTNVPFITEDSRPILACFICCAQLKKCYRFQKKCLETEEQFANMMNEDYKRKPLINQDQFEFFHGFIRTPVETINIVDVVQTESIVVKEELPAVCERLDDIRSIIEKEEHLSDNDQEAVNYRFTVQNNCLNIEYVPPRHFESDSEDDVPLIEVKTEVEEGNEVSEVRRKAEVMSSAPVVKKPRLEDEITAEQSKTDTEIIQDTQNSAFIAKQLKLEDTITAEHSKPDPEMFQDDQSCTFNPFIAKNSEVQNNINNTIVDIDCQINSNEDISLVQEFKPFKCDICHNNFKRKSDLLIHKQIHTGEKPFKCHICERSFSRKNNLVKHIRVHTGEKPYKCDVCERSFTERCNLTKHIRVHLGEKLYKCHLCPLSFSQNVNLKSHIQVHTGEKPFKCDTCPSSFSHKADLCKHIRVHTGEKPFKCEICQSSFTQKANLSRHIRTHT